MAADDAGATVILPPEIRHSKPVLYLEPLAVGTDTAARLLGVSRPTIYQYIGRADFPSFKLGGRVLISVEALREWVRRQCGEGSAQ